MKDSFERLFHNAPIPMLVIDAADLRVTWINDRARAMLPLSQGDFFTQCICPAQEHRCAMLTRRFVVPRERFNSFLNTAQGIRLAEVRASALMIEDRRHVHLCLSDITASRVSLRRLKDSLRESHGLLAAAALILISLDSEGKITNWNSQAEEAFNLRRKNALGVHLSRLPLGWDAQALNQAIDTSRAEERVSRLNDFRYARPDGKVGFLKILCHAMPLHAVTPPPVLVIMEDVTQHKILESQLLQAQKLESIGQLASGIAHEINTPIQYVSGNLSFLKDAFARIQDVLTRYNDAASLISRTVAPDSCKGLLPSPGELDELKALLAEVPGSIDDSLDGVDRVANIVGAMKRFSHPDLTAKHLMDVNKAVESILTITRNEWKYSADLALDLDPSKPMIFCVPGDFNQAVLNVVVNAAHAMSEKYRGQNQRGVLSVRTSSEGRNVVVSVSDTGGGIPEDIRTRIFDPFFTTKEVGKGTGQGLAIVHSVLARHNGTVEFESVPGQGTTFTLRFPTGEEIEQ